MTTRSEHGEAEGSEDKGHPIIFTGFIYTIFSWCLTGVAVIYGIRIYADAPIHPSFIPIIGAVFSAILAFTLVMTFKIVSGPVNISSGSFKLEGASGPIVLWCVCFLSIAYGLYLMGMIDVAKAPVDDTYKSCAIHDVLRKQCAQK